jgi:hypothetical protein
MTAMHVDKGRFAPVDADDGLDFADLLCQAAATGVAAAVVYIEGAFADQRTCQIAYSFYNTE